MSFLGARKFWKTKMSKTARCCFISGFCYYGFTAVELLVGPLIPSLLLILVPLQMEQVGYLWLAPGIAADMVLYPLWHRSSYGPRIWSLIMIRNWAHALALFDNIRGRHMGWQVTGSSGRKSKVRRFWIGVTAWNGGAALAWLGLAAWRMTQYGAERYAIITGFGVFYAVTVACVLWSYERKP